MRLPFSEGQFLAVFASYNSDFMTPIVLLWLLTAGALAWLALRRRGSTMVSLLLAVHWAWAGAVYHWTYFADINPAARLFGALFVAQGIFFLAAGGVKYRWGRQPRQILSMLFCSYALLYPALVLASGLHWPRMPSFGVPCPTTLLTIGLLLAVEPYQARWLSAIPLIWSLIGGSAAILLHVPPDLMLLGGAGVLLLNVAVPRVFVPRAA